MKSAAFKSASPPVKEQVYSYIRDKIVMGDIEGGEFIEEESISIMLGVSRTPVREAFLKLEAEKFIDLIPRKGARVRQITGQEIVNIYETRRLIEIYAAGRICKESIPIPDEMFSCHEKMISLYQGEPDYYQHIVNDGRFHSSMIEAVKNPVLVDVYKSIQDRKLRVAYTAVALRPDRIELIINQHQEILDALLARDSCAAEKTLSEHLQPIEDVISKLPN